MFKQNPDREKMGETANPVKYDESKIQTLSSLEHIRLRTGMYIGRLGDGSAYEDGIYILLKEIVDNSIDEYIEGYGKKIIIDIEDVKVIVRDYGRGIPLGKVVDCVSKINTGGKFNSDVFQFSVGLNGVGTKAVNALSDSFIVKSFRDGRFKEVRYSKGILIEENEGETKEPDGPSVGALQRRDHGSLGLGKHDPGFCGGCPHRLIRQ